MTGIGPAFLAWPDAFYKTRRYNMPYTKFRKGGRYCIKNSRTGKITCFDSEETREKMIKIREAFAHGFKLKGLARASKPTRTRVSRLGGKSRRR